VKSKFLICYVAIVGVVACGDDDDDQSASPPSQQVLCSLTIGMSSGDEVLAALGPATAVASSGGLTLLNYEYGESGVALSVGDLSSLMIVLDERRTQQA